MPRRPFLASVLSLLVPGLGQIYAGKSERGAAILVAVIIAGNLNALWLSAYAVSTTIPLTFFGHTLPRLIHDVFAFYGIVFWIWQTADAYVSAKKGVKQRS